MWIFLTGNLQQVFFNWNMSTKQQEQKWSNLIDRVVTTQSLRYLRQAKSEQPICRDRVISASFSCSPRAQDPSFLCLVQRAVTPPLPFYPAPCGACATFKWCYELSASPVVCKQLTQTELHSSACCQPR